MTENTQLVKLGEEHHKLVKGLKQSLMLGQIGFLEAGKFLYKIWSEKTYATEDSSREVTFTEFIQRPDLPIPGHSKDARLRTTQKLIRIYKFFLLDNHFSEKLLAPVGYTKLEMLIPVLKDHEKKAESWLNKAMLLTVEDLKEEIRQKDSSLAELLECPHNEIVELPVRFRCPKCLSTWNKDPRKQ